LNPGDIYGDLAINICRVENQTHTWETNHGPTLW
jgi:hypothetical protein